MRFRSVLLLVVCLAMAVSAFAQNPTGTISGKVSDPEGLAMPGVTVTVASPNLQGTRTAVTSANGDYIFPLLPAGDYTLTFELSGFKTVTVKQTVAVAQTHPVSVKMEIQSLTETVNVVGKVETISQTAQVATSYKSDLIASLPTTRNLNDTVSLAPGVAATGPGGNLSISGSLSYESLFLVNGVVVNENLRGQALDLYIEDALQETTTSTAAVSAEYGRFSGGVVNAITKSGGNMFSGTFRTTLNNDSWRTVTPYKESKVDKTVPTYEYTLGGPIMKDRLWFFTAGRVVKPETAQTLRYTKIPYVFNRDQKRFEGKLTYTVNANHNFRGAYTDIRDSQFNNNYSNEMDLASLYDRKTPQNLLSLNYNGILSPKFFLEAQYSQRRFSFVGSGSQFTDPIKGTLLIDNVTSGRFNSPTFCGVCGDEKRDNRNFLVKGSYFLSTQKTGAHNLVFGYDMFDDQRFVNNHQSGSDYRVYLTKTIIDPATNVIYPVFNNDTTSYIMWNPILQPAKTARFRTYSMYVNDAWRFTNNLSLNLGVRFDKNAGRDSNGVEVVKDSAFSPRLALTWDPKGDSKLAFNASYARYVMSMANSVGGSGAAGGQPATFDYYYTGPAINTGTGPYVTADAALAQMWTWFNANGGTNMPFFSASVPGVDTKVSSGLKSPNTNEYTVGLTKQLGKATLRADFVYRKYQDFYSTHVDTTTGKAQDANGKSYDLNVVENTNDVKRSYKGLNIVASYRATRRLNLNGNWTISSAYGNFDGETSTGGPATASIHAYPEYREASWNYPTGPLGIDQRHRVRGMVTFELPLPERVGTVNLGAITQFQSGTPYSGIGSIDVRPYVTNPGYSTPQGGTSVSYYFTPRGSFLTEARKRTDLSVNYNKRLAGKLQLFAQAQILNVFNQFALEYIGGINTSVLTARNDSKTYAKFNPFTDTPVLGTNYAYGPDFGKAIAANAYTTPRTFRCSVGLRF
jgi:outer membrane receptor for ferrienterochelin and colicin